ncbi:Alpha/Beta hydrolase protein [Crucibulum laeve]|uniref:Alpha/Beta hydrolase protein n=1 Tax=Crucibulum laeve TaxID=68775 RepID=A0A5C3MJU2_9AGAR|nr:Alpha/Beta hydrolase protein [Crucibulum laeve]
MQFRCTLAVSRRPFLLHTKPNFFSASRKLNMSARAYTESWLSGPHSTQFYTRTYPAASTGKPKAAFVFIHGFAEHIGRYSHIHPVLAERGVGVFAFDQRGYGLTAQDTEGKKSKGSTYGKTSWKEQMGDVQWAIEQAKKAWEGVPVFLMGHSMGGGEVLGFATQDKNSPYHATAKSLAGVIATSPLIRQSKPAPKVLRWVGSKASALSPNTLVPADVNPDDLSRDPAVGQAYLKDKLVKQSGSLKGISDMLSQGEALLSTYYKDWPKDLPCLIIHGTEDKVTSHNASQLFLDKITAMKKHHSLYEGGYHELQNEPNGVQQRLTDEIIAWIEEVLTSSVTTEMNTAAKPEAAAPAESIKADSKL